MKTKIDQAEKELLERYEKDSVKLRSPSQKEIEEIKAMARKTLRKDRRVTIRLYDHDLKGIQKKALEKGLPYQTLISSMIHQYVEGELVETKAS
jgi:predicted DNA binding CopG/RHH family protein